MSRIPFVSDDEMMIDLPTDFYEIRRLFEVKGKGH